MIVFCKLLSLSCCTYFSLPSSNYVANVLSYGTQVGVGMCMEGIEQNPVVYELMSEMAFRNDKVVVKVIVISNFQLKY